MGLFRRNKDKNGSSEPAADMMSVLMSRTLEDLADEPEVRHQERIAAERMVGRAKIVTRHQEVLHQPGGIAHIREAADYIELGAGRTYIAALEDIEFAIENQLMVGN